MNLLKFYKKRQVGLALSSGGAKGIAHISIIECLESLEIPIHLIAGSSIGALIGAIYSVGNLKSFKQFLLNLKMNEMISYFDPTFPKSGMIEGKKIMNLLKKFIPESLQLEELPIPLNITATDFLTGLPVIIKKGNVLDAIRASISIPGIFTPIRYGDTYLIDGGIANPLPIDNLKRMGANLTIAINLHPGVPKRKLKSYTKEKRLTKEVNSNRLEMSESKFPVNYSEIVKKVKNQLWINNIKKWLDISKKEKPNQVPNIFEIMAQSIDIFAYSNTMLILKYNKPTMLIEPNLLNEPMLGFNQAKRILDLGADTARNAKQELLKKIKSRI